MRAAVGQSADPPRSRDSVLVVIPAYNEEQTIAPVVSALLGARHDVVVVDDGSSDNTSSLALAAGATVLRHPINRGQGASLQTGLAYATSTSHTYVATFDADGQHDEADIVTMIEALERSGADVALGSRFLGTAPDIPWARHLLLKAAILFTTLTERVSLTDAHNGLRLFRSGVVSRVRIHQDGMAHASELIQQIRTLRLSYIEVPVTVRYTEYSKAKGQSGGSAIGILIDLLAEKLR